MSAGGICTGCGVVACDCTCGCGCDEPGFLTTSGNRAGLSRIATRLGGHGSFVADATRALSSAELPALRALGTRAGNDPLMALLDGWAMIADVLTFYRDRFANECYLRTATEELSLRALAAQVGYRPRPGVSASVALAYQLDPTAQPATIAAGARVQSVPRPGEQMQSFETMQPLDARAEWSEMAPRQKWLPPINRIDALMRREIRLGGAQLVVRPGERLLFVFGPDPGWQVVREVAAAKVNLADDCVDITLKPRPGLTPELAKKLLDFLDKRDVAAKVSAGIASYMLGASPGDAQQVVSDRVPELYKLFAAIRLAPAAAGRPVAGHGLDAILAGAMALVGPLAPPGPRAVAAALGRSGGTRTALLANQAPEVARALYSAWRNLAANEATPNHAPEVHLLRLVAGAFGSNAPALLPAREPEPVDNASIQPIDLQHMFLDTVAQGVEGGGFVLVDTPAGAEAPARLVRLGRVREVQETARSDYGLTARVSRLDVAGLADDKPLGLLPGDDGSHLTVRFLRQVLYTAQSEPVTLAPEPVATDVEGDTIMLDTLYPQMAPGRTVLVAGTRSDIVVDGVPVPGVAGGELAQVAAVSQEALAHSPGDTLHTVLHLTAPLTYRYETAATTVYGNIVMATHGETLRETLGSGDAGQAFQSFALRRAPLTFVAAPTTSGVTDALRVEANGVALAEIDVLLDAGSNDRVFQLTVDTGGAGTIEGGDGTTGMRMPTGSENISATYRVGIGTAGNVDAGQISLLATRPLGVRGVVNPLRASGGSDRDGIEAIRRNTPVPTLALSPLARLVSIEDYDRFARAFAGIGDVSAAVVSDGRHRTVYVTVAGIDDAPIDPGNMLIGALVDAYRRYGDPALPVEVAVRERVTLLVQANVALAPDADRSLVDAAIRAQLGNSLSFANRGLGRPVYRSEVIALVQATAGVDHVEIDVFGGISDAVLQDPALLDAAVHALRKQSSEGRPLAFVAAELARPAPPPEVAPGLASARLGSAAKPTGRLLPAQTAYLRADVPDTLVINWSQGPRND